jgi:FkbM family methyltransferase
VAKHLLRGLLRRLGLTVRRYSPATSPEAQIQTLLSHHGVDLVLDVGANEGQHALALRRAGYRGHIVSFEPLSAAWAACAKHASRDPLWAMAPRAALGEREGTVDIHVSRNSVSSSLLPMCDTHRNAAPTSDYVGVERVELHRLDGLAAQAVVRAARPFLKVDTQGYERQVLAGATGLLPRLVGVQLEMSLTPLYEGSATLPELLALMQEWGFQLHALLPAFIDPASGRTLQVDGLFFRANARGT